MKHRENRGKNRGRDTMSSTTITTITQYGPVSKMTSPAFYERAPQRLSRYRTYPLYLHRHFHPSTFFLSRDFLSCTFHCHLSGRVL